MIKSIRNRGLRELFETGRSRRVQPKHVERLKRILSLLNVVTHARELTSPGLRLHRLEPRKADRYSVWVDENFRVTFEFDGTDVIGVNYEDYH